MKSPFLSLTTGGILAILLGLLFIGFSSHHSGQNDEFLERGLLREGRVVSHAEPGASSAHALRLKTNVSPQVSETDIQIIEVAVKEDTLEKAPVGSLIKLVLIADDPPRARLAGSVKRTTYRFGYVVASLCISLGLLLIWLAWRHEILAHLKALKAFTNSKQRSQAPKPAPPQTPKSPAMPDMPALPDLMERQLIKDPLLYDGAFEFSYSSEKTSIELKDGTLIRVSQYRPVTDLPQVLADKDLLHILRTAQSNWELVDTIKTGQLALSFLRKERHLSEADQFFINGPYLGLLFRDEIENGRWHSYVRGLWKITPLSRTLGHLASGDPGLAKAAAFEVLAHPDLPLIASLAPGLPTIRRALKKTPRTGKNSDDRRFIARAADVIDALSQGNCYCQVFAKGSDPPTQPMKKGKFTLKTGTQKDKQQEVICAHCLKQYRITEHPGSYFPYYVWDLKK